MVACFTTSNYLVTMNDLTHGRVAPSIVSKHWLNRRRFYLAIGVVALIVTPLAVYYAASYNSAHGTIVQLASATRRFDQGPPSRLTFTVDAHVWSWGASIPTQVNSPIFNLYVDTFSLPILEYGISASFQPGGYASYHLTFATADRATIAAVRGASSSTVRISMDALVNAGFYSEERVSSDSSAIVW